MLLSLVLVGCAELPYQPAPPASFTWTDPAPPTLERLVTDETVQRCPDSVDLLLAVDPAADPAALFQALPALVDPLLGGALQARLWVLDVGPAATAPPLLVDPLDPAAVQGALTSIAFDPLAGSPVLVDRVAEALADPALPATDADLRVIGWLQAPDASALVTDAELVTLLDSTDPRSALSVLGPQPVQDDLVDLALDTGGSVGPADAVTLGEVVLETVRPHPDLILSQVPVAGTIDVAVHTADGPDLAFGDMDWTLDPVRNAVVFDQFVPECGDTVQATYIMAP